LLGLYDYHFEILVMFMHIEYMEKIYGLGPHAISAPHIEPATGSTYASNRVDPCGYGDNTIGTPHNDKLER
jgi:2-iminoacetate synthase